MYKFGIWGFKKDALVAFFTNTSCEENKKWWGLKNFWSMGESASKVK